MLASPLPTKLPVGERPKAAKNGPSALQGLREGQARDSRTEKRRLRKMGVLNERAGWKAEARRPFRLKRGAMRTPEPEKLPADAERLQARA